MTPGMVLIYSVIFLAMYIQIFFLVTFIERRGTIIRKGIPAALSHFPLISIIVPCWNEEKGIEKTLLSLLALDYPKDKLDICVVDDGSTDTTQAIARKYETHPSIRVFTKENGGKFSALNLGLTKVSGEYIACLDADSRVSPDVFTKMLPRFEDPHVMAVIPAALLEHPETLIQRAQKVEYTMAVFFKKILSLINGLHVTPGTLPLYRRKVFEQIGNFRPGHQGEDMEIAFRMHQARMYIDQVYDAHVYTVPPRTVRALFRQRTRWIYAFLNNLIDYRSMIFGKHGDFSWFTLPTSIISIFAVISVFFFSAYKIVKYIVETIMKIHFGGFHFNGVPQIDLFYLGSTTVFLMALMYILVFCSIGIGYYLTYKRLPMSYNFILFLVIYSVISPFWLMKAIYKTIFSRQMAWR